jgi:LysR family transcriptional regulator, glycine cleavage system transcriptional activator
LMDGPKALRKPADIKNVPLLHDDIMRLSDRIPGWQSWIEAAGIANVDLAKGRRFGQSNMSIQAAIEGLGVALGRLPLVADDLAAGRLVRPFDLAIPSGYDYYFVCPQRQLSAPKIAAFRTWLLAETAAFIETASA